MTAIRNLALLLVAAVAFGQPRVVLVDIDGVRRDTFEDAYLAGQMPNVSRILGEVHHGQGFGTSVWFENATAVFPAITMAGQASIFTGVLPARHGIPGNQWFDRATNRVIDYFSATGISCVYGFLLISVQECGGGFANQHLEVPTVYEAATAAGKTSLVVFSQFWKGATHVVSPSVSELAFIRGTTVDYQKFDTVMMDRALEAIRVHGLPDLLTLYFIGADGVGHHDGTRGQAAYLTGTIDLQMGRFLDQLATMDPEWLAHTQFIITSDHGRTDAPATPEDSSIGSHMQEVLSACGYEAGRYRIVENGGVVHVYLKSRLTGANWTDPLTSDDILPAAQALVSDPELKQIVDSVAYRPHSPGKGYALYGSTLDAPQPLLARLEEIDSPRSGDVLLLLKRGHYFKNTERTGSQHGSIFDEDLAVPIALAPGGLHTGRSLTPLSIADVPRIVAASLGFALLP